MAESEAPYGYIYRITNKVNGKTYIGQRMYARDTHWLQYMGSGRAVIAAIAKYGKENFSKELVEEHDSPEEMTRREVEIIKNEWKVGKGEYNLGITPSAAITAKLTPEKEANRRALISASNKKRAESSEDYEFFRSWNEQRRAAYVKFVEVNKNDVISSYSLTQSAVKTAESLNLSKKWVTRLLKEEGILLPPRNIAGYNHSEETKAKISKSNQERDPPHIRECEQCGKCFTSRKTYQKTCSLECGNLSRNRTRSISDEDMRRMYLEENMSIRQIAAKMDMNRGTIHNRIKRMELKKP